MELEEILSRHAAKYPLMTPCDAVKLVYQNEFGGGHLISDENACLERLKIEYDAQNRRARSAEYIGNGISRLYLDGAKQLGLDPETVSRMFISTARSHTGNRDSFLGKLEALSRVTRGGLMPFDADELAEYLDEYSRAGMPPVSHSDIYRENYLPSYRIVDRSFIRLIPVMLAVKNALKTKVNVVAAIDGRCASGKSTAAELLSQAFNGAPVIHMDDFFLPPELRREDRYAEIGGNVHYERFCSEALPNLAAHRAFAYRRFDCSKMALGETVNVPESEITIVEGVYSLHPRFGDYADVRVFCDIEPREQLRRLYIRDGDYAEVFRDKWIPLEERYFADGSVLSGCDVWLS